MQASAMRTYLGVSAAVNACAAGFIAVRYATLKPRLASAKCWAAFSGAVAGWSLLYLAWQLADNENTALLFCRLLLVPAGFIGPFFYHHMSVLVGRPPRKATLVFLYALGLLNAACALGGDSVRSVEPLFELPYWPRAGDGFLVFLVTYGVFVVACGRGVLAAKNATGYNAEAIRIHCVITLAGVAVGFTNLPGWYGIGFPPWTNALVAPYLIGASYTAYSIMPSGGPGATGMTRQFLVVLVLGGFAAALSALSISTLSMFGVVELQASAWVAFLAYHFLVVLMCYLVIPRVMDFEARFWHFLHPAASNIARAVSHLERALPACRSEDCGPAIAREMLSASGAPAVAFFRRSEAGTLDLLGTAGAPDDAVPKTLDETNVIVRECATHGGTVTLRWVDLGTEAPWAASWHSAIAVLGDKSVTSLLLLARPRALRTPMLQELQHALHRIDGLLQARTFASQAARQESLIRLGYLAAGIAHEVRNPLTSMKTYVELTHRGKLTGAREAELYAEVTAGMQRMLGAIEAVGTFADNRDSARSEVPLREVVEQTTALLATALREANVICANETAADLVVWANRRELLQIFANLVTNAIDAMAGQGGGTVTIAAERLSQRGSIRIRVADTGPGLPDWVAARLGEPFVTARSAPYAPGRKSGYGLGLSIVMDRVTAHGGKLSYQAPAFIFTLPQPASTPVARAPSNLLEERFGPRPRTPA
jgi:signal transduction histidine kinase